MRKKTMFIGALLTLALLVSGAGASGAAVRDGKASGRVVSCLDAVGPVTYSLCVALREQPAYSYRYQGAKVSVPSGRVLLRELAADGLTPTKNTKSFRVATRSLISEFFRHNR